MSCSGSAAKTPSTCAPQRSTASPAPASRASPLPRAHLRVSRRVGLLGVAEGGVDARVTESFTDGREADAAVDEGLGVAVAEVVDGHPGETGALRVLRKPRLQRLVAQRSDR